MFRMFSKWYLSLVASLIASAFIGFVMLDQWNNKRFQNYAEQLSIVSRMLIAEGWQRQSPVRRDNWISLASSLTGVNWQVTDTPPEPLVDWVNQAARLNYPLQEQGLYLVGEISQWTQLLSGTGILILNDLSRLAAEQRGDRLDDLISLSPTPLSRIVIKDEQLDFLGQRQLAQGHNFIEQSENQFSIYVPLPAGSALKLGPIRPFFWLHPIVLFYAALATLGLVALLVLLFYWPLMRRLQQITRAVDRISTDRSTVAVPEHPQDELGQMASHINLLANRLVDQIERNQELNRAVSHDLKTPLARMRFSLELLNPSNQQRKAVEEIETDIKILSDLVDELLLYHQLASPSQQHINRVPLNPILEEVVNRLKNNSIQIDVHVPEAWSFPMHPSHVRRLISNLLENAQRHATSKIEWAVVLEPDQQIWLVDDDGSGIEPALRDKVFEPFFRGDSARNLDQSGHGLGLALCRSIVQHYHGTIQVEDSPLSGCRFVIQLPYI